MAKKRWVVAVPFAVFEKRLFVIEASSRQDALDRWADDSDYIGSDTLQELCDSDSAEVREHKATREEEMMIQKCTQPNCQSDAYAEVCWPGEPIRRVCWACAQKLLALGAAIGCPVPARPVDPDILMREAADK